MRLNVIVLLAIALAGTNALAGVGEKCSKDADCTSNRCALDGDFSKGPCDLKENARTRSLLFGVEPPVEPSPCQCIEKTMTPPLRKEEPSP